MKPYFRKSLSKLVIILTSLALFRELTRVLEIAVDFDSDSALNLDFILGILTLIIDFREGSLKVALIGLAKY